jgi:hypothetical protein
MTEKMADHDPSDPSDTTHPAPSDPGAGGLVRLAAVAWWHTTEWTVGTSLRATRRVLGVVAAPETAPELIDDIRHTVRAAARELAGIADAPNRIRNVAPSNDAARRFAGSVPGGEAALRVVEASPGADVVRRVAEAVQPQQTTQEDKPSPLRARRNGAKPTLREQGDALLYKSRDVNYEEDSHPAYERLVESLAPDEARILRLLLFGGPQPAVDVRTGGPLGLINSRLLAPGLNMIGSRAGLRYVERVPSYLTNLNRLGLIWFSRETLRDAERYQVVEAQPAVLEAMHTVRQAKVVRRSIHLTPFGEGFCRNALVSEQERLDALPEHASPVKPREPRPPELTE